MVATNIILLGILILFALSIIAIIIYLKTKKYTKGKFAFRAISPIVLFGGAIILSYKKDSFLVRSLEALLNYVGIKVDQQPPDYFLLILQIIVLLIVTVAFVVIHKNWNDDTAKNDEVSGKSKTSILNQTINNLSVKFPGLVNKKYLNIYMNKERKFEPHIRMEVPKNSQEWKYSVRELFIARNPQLSINIDNGWHETNNCWFGFDKITKFPIAILVETNDPVDDDIINFIKYANSVVGKDEEINFFAAIRNGSLVNEVVIGGNKVKYCNEESLLDNLVDFTDYKEFIVRRVTKEQLPNSSLSLENVYVVSDYYLDKHKSNRENNIEKYIDNWLAEKSQRHLAILGDYGEGKTTCSLMLAYRMLSRMTKWEFPIPILIELRGSSPRDLSPQDLLAIWSAKYGINPVGLFKLAQAGKLLFIFEGFDEVSLVGNSAMRIEHFKTLWKLCYPDVKLIFTGRPNFFLDDDEMMRALELDENITLRPYCSAVYLAPFKKDQIKQALRGFSKKTSDQILGVANVDRHFMDLIQRPSLLYMTGHLWERGLLIKYADNINSARVIGLYIDDICQRQAFKITDDTPNHMRLNTSERLYFTETVAAYMASSYLPNQIYKTQFRDIITKTFSRIPREISETSTYQIVDEISGDIRNRFEENEYAIDEIETDVRSCGLLVPDSAKNGSYKFAHKSFMEYLAAKSLWTTMRKSSFNTPGDLVNMSVQPIIESPQMFKFLVEIIYNDVEKYCRSDTDFIELFNTLLAHNLIIGGSPKKAYKYWDRFLAKHCANRKASIPHVDFVTSLNLLLLVCPFNRIIIHSNLREFSPFALIAYTYQILYNRQALRINSLEAKHWRYLFGQQIIGDSAIGGTGMPSGKFFFLDPIKYLSSLRIWYLYLLKYNIHHAAKEILPFNYYKRINYSILFIINSNERTATNNHDA